jgi:hypothetical protein
MRCRASVRITLGHEEMTKPPKSFWQGWRRDFGTSLLTTGFLLVWVIFTITLFAILDHFGVLSESTGGIFFIIVGLGGAGVFGTLIQRGLARRTVPHCQHCGASLSMYLNKRKQYANLIMGKCPKCNEELSQQPDGAVTQESTPNAAP